MRGWLITLVAVALLPALDALLPPSLRIASLLPAIFVFAIAGLGLNVVTGFTGLLNLGAAAFMAIGAYAYAILTCASIYPFQLGFWWGPGGGDGDRRHGRRGAGAADFASARRLPGDRDAGVRRDRPGRAENLEGITKGTQGINPLPQPTWFGSDSSGGRWWIAYYLGAGILALAVIAVRNLRAGRVGRLWAACARTSSPPAPWAWKPCAPNWRPAPPARRCARWPVRCTPAFTVRGGDPGSYNFQLSTVILCIVIIGGMGSIPGVLLGALIMVGFNSILLTKLDALLAAWGWRGDSNVFAAPSNWKYLVLGLALLVMMRWRPEGLLPAREVQAGTPPSARR